MHSGAAVPLVAHVHVGLVGGRRLQAGAPGRAGPGQAARIHAMPKEQEGIG